MYRCIVQQEKALPCRGWVLIFDGNSTKRSVATEPLNGRVDEKTSIIVV